MGRLKVSIVFGNGTCFLSHDHVCPNTNKSFRKNSCGLYVVRELCVNPIPSLGLSTFVD